MHRTELPLAQGRSILAPSGALLASLPLRIVISQTAAWQSFAAAFVGLV